MYLEILSDEQLHLLPFVASLKKEFYLVGGTAIALQIGHRQSIDFDLFKKGNVQREKLAHKLHEQKLTFQLLFANAEGFHITVRGVKITFFQFPFDIPVKKSIQNIRMPDLLTLAAMKAYALGRRAKWKDYVDLYFILRDHHSLDEVIEKSQLLFQELFSPKLFRQQICYFQDIDYSEEVSFLQGFEVSDASIKDFLMDISTTKL